MKLLDFDRPVPVLLTALPEMRQEQRTELKQPVAE
jgi:hypothetical protein